MFAGTFGPHTARDTPLPRTGAGCTAPNLTPIPNSGSSRWKRHSSLLHNKPAQVLPALVLRVVYFLRTKISNGFLKTNLYKPHKTSRHPTPHTDSLTEPARGGVLRERAGEKRGNALLPCSSTWFFWKQSQAMANKTNFRKTRLYRTTEPHTPQQTGLGPSAQTRDAMLWSPCTPSLHQLPGPRTTEDHSQCPWDLLPTLLRLTP